MTFRELDVELKAAARRQRQAQLHDLWLAHTTAAFVRARTLEPFHQVARRLHAPPRSRSLEQDLAIVAQANAAWGGRDLRRKDEHG